MEEYLELSGRRISAAWHARLRAWSQTTLELLGYSKPTGFGGGGGCKLTPSHEKRDEPPCRLLPAWLQAAPPTLAAQLCPQAGRSAAVARALCFISQRQSSCVNTAATPWLLNGHLSEECFCSSLEGRCGGKYQQQTRRQPLPGGTAPSRPSL